MHRCYVSLDFLHNFKIQLFEFEKTNANRAERFSVTSEKLSNTLAGCIILHGNFGEMTWEEYDRSRIRIQKTRNGEVEFMVKA